MALQFTFYRMHKVPAAHYESAALRKYLHGRTETIRSCSTEAVAFSKAMLDGKSSDADKAKLLRSAVNVHKEYTVAAVQGYGVDRHFLGLRLTAREKGLEVPKLFQHPAFTKTSHYRIASSQVACKIDGFMCYGPVVMDGYGTCYNPRDDDIKFGISCMVSNPETDATKYREELEKSLMEMHDMLAKTQKSKM